MDPRHDPTTPFATTEADVVPGRFGSATESVKLFLNKLRRIPLEEWARCAEPDPRLEPAADAAPSLAQLRELERDDEARNRLHAVMESMPEVASRIKHRIDTSLAVAESFASRATVARMRRVAREAAYAVAARPSLTASEFERLYRPFSTLISAADLQLF